MTLHSSSGRRGHRGRQSRTPLIAAVAAGVLGVTIAAQAAMATDARSTAGTAAVAETRLTGTRQVSGTFDGGRARFTGAGALDGADRAPLFELADGAVLKNVIIGAPAGDGVHCLGSCTLENVFWEDTEDDAATFLGTSEAATYVVRGGGAPEAADQVFRVRGAGTLTVRDFAVSGSR
ncbi:pectate lyase [Streptomyces sp. Amel2xC10]|uniref:pectate lyase n=1 Tax=Streptomyces sp. Amel2xC10 TaxID=1305826 RepID=UPI000A08BA4C|nr:pectate lyase [Streptomyces sp. Amel2xC10]SME91225.1 Pectate lyase [Streptomyces sp. Amel2xC10]